MSPFRTLRRFCSVGVVLFAVASVPSLHAHAQTQKQSRKPKSSPAQQKAPTPQEELQKAIDDSGNDRAALRQNLEAYLRKYPDTPQRPRIYRALVEASLQLRDASAAADYAERLVALTPEDMSITLLAIQLLERTGDEAGMRRATSYASRVLDYVQRSNASEKSPRVSPEEWEAEKKKDQMTILLLRGRLYSKLRDSVNARKDYAASYEMVPNATAAEKLGEIDELSKNLPAAIEEYARAFALADGASGSPDRLEIRQKLGNVWRLQHGSEDGLGAYLLASYDKTIASLGGPQTRRNQNVKDIFQFKLRTAPGEAAYPLASARGKVLVVNFWATWCGPCRALEPQFEQVASEFQPNQDVVFLGANCDEDETLVAPYLEEEKPKVTMVFSDGLAELFAVESFPTVVVIGRDGKVAYRSEGYSGDAFPRELTAAVNRALAPPESTGAAAPAQGSQP